MRLTSTKQRIKLFSVMAPLNTSALSANSKLVISHTKVFAELAPLSANSKI